MEKKTDSCLKKQYYDDLYLLEIQEIERKRISNELHDTTVQNLTMLVHKAELCEQLIDKDVLQAKLELLTMKDTLRKTIQELRNIIYNLRPMTVDDLGLTETIERFISKKEYESHEMKISCIIQGKEPNNIKSIIIITLLRIIQELYNNAEKHASAKKFEIFIEFQKDSIALRIIDDGVGFSFDEVSLNEKNFGISIMRERVSMLSGRIEIDVEKGKGTKVYIEVPIEQEETYAD